MPARRANLGHSNISICVRGEHHRRQGDLHDSGRQRDRLAATFGKPLPFHVANMCDRPAWTGSGSPSPCEALRATSQVAAGPSASIRFAVTTVVASTRALDRPVASAIPGTQIRHMSASSPESLRKFTRVVHDVVAPDPGGLVRVRRTAEVLQQRGIEHIADFFICAADDLGEPGCD